MVAELRVGNFFFRDVYEEVADSSRFLRFL